MLSVITLEQSNKWDEIVKTFSDYDVYYLSGYVKAFEIHGDGKPLLFSYSSENLKAINVVMLRDVADDSRFSKLIPKEQYYDLATPYGYGGWLVEGTGGFKDCFNEYKEWCKNNNIICEFVRLHPVLQNQRYIQNEYNVIPLGKTISMDLSSPEIIWENITSKNRNVIRKAQKSGLVIKHGKSEQLIDAFMEIYNGTMDKDSADPYYYFKRPFYESVLNDLKDECEIFYAEMPNGDVAAASIMLFDNKYMNYHLSGSRKEFMSLAPTNLLLYEAALWGYEQGYKTLHLGGGVGSHEDGLFKFKKAFTRNEGNQYYIANAIFDNKTYSELVNKRDNIEDTAFFPKYRA